MYLRAWYYPWYCDIASGCLMSSQQVTKAKKKVRSPFIQGIFEGFVCVFVFVFLSERLTQHYLTSGEGAGGKMANILSQLKIAGGGIWD